MLLCSTLITLLAADEENDERSNELSFAIGGGFLLAKTSPLPRSVFNSLVLLPSGERSRGDALSGGGRDFLRGGRAAGLPAAAANGFPIGARGAWKKIYNYSFINRSRFPVH
jgi:hypothetical protein